MTRESQIIEPTVFGHVEGPARLVPVQKRSRERFERILDCAAQVMIEKGSEAFRMSDIVERTGVPFGSLYQYFPDKTAIIGTLAERYNALGRACVAAEMEAVRTQTDIYPTLCRLVDGYYSMFVEAPVMRDIWQAVQGDRALQAQDEADGAHLAGLLYDALHRVAPHLEPYALTAFSRLIMTLIAATVRQAIALAPPDAEAMLTLFKRILPQDLSGLD